MDLDKFLLCYSYSSLSLVSLIGTRGIEAPDVEMMSYTARSVATACFQSFFLLISLSSLVRGKTIVHDFSVGWVTANPDGAFDRPTIGINGEWPLPLISATVGDHIQVNVKNELGNASTSLHFHGFFQNGTNHMDGAVGVTQCAIPPGSSFTYEFDVSTD